MDSEPLFTGKDARLFAWMLLAAGLFTLWTLSEYTRGYNNGIRDAQCVEAQP